MVIKKITRNNKNTLKDLNALLLQLSSREYQMTAGHLQKILKNNNIYCFGLYDGKKIIGTATLMVVFQLTGRKGYVEDVVVDEKYRGRGLGKKLMLHIINLAKKLHIDVLELKSEPHRKIANSMYQKLQFANHDANVYQIKFYAKKNRQ